MSKQTCLKDDLVVLRHLFYLPPEVIEDFLPTPLPSFIRGYLRGISTRGELQSVLIETLAAIRKSCAEKDP